MNDKYHKVINGKTVATNLPKAKALTAKQKKDLEITRKFLLDINMFSKQ